MVGIRGDVHVRCHANGHRRGGFKGQWFRRLTSSRRACLPGRRRPSSRPSPWTLSTLAPTRSRRESKEKVESGNALPARGATRLVSSAPATSQTRARCELVDPRENDDRQSFTQQCPPTLRATGLFPIKGRFLRLLSASEGPLRESGEESSFSNKIQSRLAIDELISPINLGKWCGRVRAILTQNNQLSYAHFVSKTGFGE